MTTHDYQQKSGQGCLAACLAYLYGITPTVEYEKMMIEEGLFAYRDSYALGMLTTFSKYTQNVLSGLTVTTNSRNYAGFLKEQARTYGLGLNIESGNTMKVICQGALPNGSIVYVDSYVLGTYEHSPHFVMVVKKHKKMLTIYDPWHGKCWRINPAKITQGIRLLKHRLHYAPIVISRHRDRLL